MNHDSEVVAFRMVLNPGMADEYRRRHEEIWPDLRDALSASGVIDYRIFLDPGTRHLFAVMTRRRNHTLHTLRDTPLMRRWWSMMSDIMATNPDRSPTEEALLPMFTLE